MTTLRRFASPPTRLMILVATLAALGTAGFVYPADRTVVGELWSQDG